jgi:hypothetical protein
MTGAKSEMDANEKTKKRKRKTNKELSLSHTQTSESHQQVKFLRSEVFTAVTMMNEVF